MWKITNDNLNTAVGQRTCARAQVHSWNEGEYLISLIWKVTLSHLHISPSVAREDCSIQSPAAGGLNNENETPTEEVEDILHTQHMQQLYSLMITTLSLLFWPGCFCGIIILP